nr:uncharacterized protein LOC109159918 [Ipomoea batatas]
MAWGCSVGVDLLAWLKDSFDRVREQWVKPGYGTQKLNIDASVHREVNHIGMGWILRD